jgi:hypothetical protein
VPESLSTLCHSRNTLAVSAADGRLLLVELSDAAADGDALMAAPVVRALPDPAAASWSSLPTKFWRATMGGSDLQEPLAVSSVEVAGGGGGGGLVLALGADWCLRAWSVSSR